MRRLYALIRRMVIVNWDLILAIGSYFGTCKLPPGPQKEDPHVQSLKNATDFDTPRCANTRLL